MYRPNCQLWSVQTRIMTWTYLYSPHDALHIIATEISPVKKTGSPLLAHAMASNTPANSLCSRHGSMFLLLRQLCNLIASSGQMSTVYSTQPAYSLASTLQELMSQLHHTLNWISQPGHAGSAVYIWRCEGSSIDALSMKTGMSWHTSEDKLMQTHCTCLMLVHTFWLHMDTAQQSLQQ